jgi:secreted PhoX family phosphatase
VALAGPFQGFLARAAHADPLGPIGPLAPVVDLADGVTPRLALPPGYIYRSFGTTGDLMSDGVLTPGRHDGMTCFDHSATTVRLVRNHEETTNGAPFGDPSKAYDGNTRGGTTTVEVDRKSRELVADWVSLNGTMFNCAGGPTPWGTWITTEETVNGPDVGPDFAGQGVASQQRHGYLYEVDVRWGPNEHPKVLPIRNAGRFAHEAAALDPRNGHIYLTEDSFESPSGVYRYIAPVNPMHARQITDGGRLQMLRVKGSTSPAVLGGILPVGAQFEVDWVDIAQPDWTGTGPTMPNDDAIRIVANQGFAQNAAKFARPEGIFYSSGAVFFSCTRGGADRFVEDGVSEYANGRGQIWRLDPHKDLLTLLFQSTDPNVLDLPDNLTVSNRGTVVICEDGTAGNFVRLLTKQGQLIDIAQNITNRPDDEFAGATISPDGQTLFVNGQAAIGRTYAIWREDGGGLRF